MTLSELNDEGMLRQVARQGQERSAQESDARDEQAMDRLARGDLGALEELYQRYARPIYSLAIRILGDERDAEEVLQDVLERAWRHAPSFDRQRGRVATWLLSMAHHVAIDVLRKRQRRPQAADSESAEKATRLIADPAPDAAEQALSNEQADLIRQALRELPDSQKQAIELAYFKELSHLEIAALLGDPLGTVKTRIRRGMERLKAVLQGTRAGNHD
ncbi:MAG TPA: sigma-70 family RNA polymerase sigma factor [Herpetosiphonaceae bacterium]